MQWVLSGVSRSSGKKAAAAAAAEPQQQQEPQEGGGRAEAREEGRGPAEPPSTVPEVQKAAEKLRGYHELARVGWLWLPLSVWGGCPGVC